MTSSQSSAGLIESAGGTAFSVAIVKKKPKRSGSAVRRGPETPPLARSTLRLRPRWNPAPVGRQPFGSCATIFVGDAGGGVRHTPRNRPYVRDPVGFGDAHNGSFVRNSAAGCLKCEGLRDGPRLSRSAQLRLRGRRNRAAVDRDYAVLWKGCFSHARRRCCAARVATVPHQRAVRVPIRSRRLRCRVRWW